MTKRVLNIGAVDGQSFSLPADLATQTIAIVGIRGAGKTVTAAVVVEELLKLRQQSVIIDPTDVWWGLKSSADGKGEGFPVVVLGGHHGDLPLTETSGAVLADFVVDHPISVVLSLRHLRKGAQRKFVTEFAEQLYYRKGEPKHRTTLFVAIDEASQFCPQKVVGDTARMVGSIQDLVRLGRSAGLGVALIDQRPATVNKDVLTQLEVLIAHRITSPQDRKAILEWIEQHDSENRRAEFLAALAPLPTGTAWFWSPSLNVFEQVQVRMRETFDSSKTPKPGEAPKVPEKIAAIDLDAIRAQLQETIGQAEANDPKALKKRIQEMESALTKGAGERMQPFFDAAGLAREAVVEATAPLRERVRELEISLKFAAGRLERAIDDLQEAASALHLNGESRAAHAPVEKKFHAPAPTKVNISTAAVRDTKSSVLTPVQPPSSLSAPQQKILDALAAYESFGQSVVDRVAVSAMAGYKPGSGHVNNVIGSLLSAGFLEYPLGGFLSLTAAGRGLARAFPLQTHLAVHDRWYAICSTPQRKLLEALIEVYPDDLSREELADRTGYTAGTGHFNNIVGSLSTLGAAEYPRKGHVRASELLFPEIRYAR